MNDLCSVSITGAYSTILCTQENFLLKANLYKINQAMPNYSFIFNPAVKKKLNRGRPFNGMFIGYPTAMKDSVKDVSPDHHRIQAIVIENSGSKTLIVNTYFPTDKNEANATNDGLEEVIAVIRDVVENVDCDTVVVTGDLNCDVSRKSWHT